MDHNDLESRELSRKFELWYKSARHDKNSIEWQKFTENDHHLVQCRDVVAKVDGSYISGGCADGTCGWNTIFFVFMRCEHGYVTSWTIDSEEIAGVVRSMIENDGRGGE